jgi:hypothetical protein
MKRQRRTGVHLPRLTVLSWSKRELAAFVLAVEQLGHYVQDLGELVDRMKAKKGPAKLSGSATDNRLKCNGSLGSATVVVEGGASC